MTAKTYRRIVLAARPVGEPKESDFKVDTQPVPEPGPKEVLVRIIYLSLDPYMRGRLRDVASYAPAVKIGEVMVGGTVGEVVKSNHPGFRPGDIVEGSLGWQEYAVATDPAALRKIDPSIAPISTANGILGMPGMTAYFGLFDVAQPKPGDTVVVSAASGAVGQVVGQLAKMMGCRAVGIAGGKAKCDFVKELGFDACVDYKAGNLDADLKAACPNGIDVYFENVGGEVSDAVYKQLNFFARIAACGSISQSNNEIPAMGPRLNGLFTGRRVRLQGFIVWDYRDRYAPAMQRMGAWVKSGKLKFREDIVDGLENAPKAFIGLLKGANFGKLQVRVGPEKG
ncbi:NADP-dependent oxidoreductase [Desertibaculum subflavum]|uniref:NADP-dependent oxidoreductase n=1 Tax=Desertibaculum subflavum TaxID=2268458 RepID=UPI000E65FEA5